eukprot:tig00000754_g3891.t1
MLPSSASTLDVICATYAGAATASSARAKAKPLKKQQEKLCNIGKTLDRLRDELPNFFERGLSYDIYHDDIEFHDGLVRTHGKNAYQTIMWALRFHGNMIFSHMHLDVLRITQPTNDTVKVRWTMRGVPRTGGDEFFYDGFSTYTIDPEGLVTSHEVENISGSSLTSYLEPFTRQWQPDAGLAFSAASDPAAPASR